LDFRVKTTRSVRVPSPSLPHRPYKEKGDEMLVFIAFLLPQASFLPSTTIEILT
jgi:hypothetical protein